MGVTGHRVVRLAPALVAGLPPVVDSVLAAVRDAAVRIGFPRVPPQLWLHSALATGADQVAATGAHALGYKVRAVLPFAAKAYREDFAAGAERAEFDRQLAAADAMLALPCVRDGSDTGYIEAGEAIVAASDFLLAVWDGDTTENAPGGTAYVVGLAEAADIPVIHIVVDRERERIGPVVLRRGEGATPLDDQATYDALLRATLTGDNPIQ